MTEQADLILLDGSAPDFSRKTTATVSIAIREGRIIYSGERSGALELKGPETRVIPIGNKTVLPGLHDAHLHFSDGARSISEQLSVRYLDLAAIREKIKSAIRVSPPGALIEAHHFHQTFFKNEKWPDKSDLDDIAPDNPVIIHRVDGHSAWVNSRTLELAGIRADTPDPEGGKIEHLQDGSPSGIIKEKATNLLSNIRAPGMVNPDAQNVSDEIVFAMDYANRLGLTSVTTSCDMKLLKKLQDLEKKGQLKLRFNLWFNYQELLVFNNVLRKLSSPFLRFELVKFFADGTLGSRTAFLFRPFRDNPENFGLPIQPFERLKEQIFNVVKNGYSVLVHCIGDRATHEVLKIFEEVRKAGFDKPILRIEHVQFLQDDDLELFAKNSVIASMQPTHCTTDLLVAEDYLQPETWQKGYRWQSILAKGISLAFGTDWPVEPLDPRRGLYSALERKNIELGIPEEGWLSREKIDIFDALQAYTGGAEIAANLPYSGGLRVGDRADIVVFDGDLVAAASGKPKSILEMPVLLTVFNGQVVYQKAAPEKAR